MIAANPGNPRLEVVAVFLWRWLPLVLLVLFLLCLGVSNPRLLHPDYLVGTILKQASFIGIVAVGMTLVLLTGGIDLSVGSCMYVSAAASGLLMERLGLPIAAGFLASLAVGALFGSVNAILVTRLRLLPFVATLGTLVAGRGVGVLLTRSESVAFPDEIRDLGTRAVLGLVPLPVVVFGLVVLVAHVFLGRTPWGRQVYAVGRDPEGATKAGVHTGRILAIVYIASGLLAALGGFVSVAQWGNVSPRFGRGDEFDAIAAAVLGGASLFGGIGTVFPGVVVGSTLLQMVAIGLASTRIDPYVRPLVEAGFIFAAVLLDSLRTRQLEKLRKVRRGTR